MAFGVGVLAFFIIYKPLLEEMYKENLENMFTANYWVGAIGFVSVVILTAPIVAYWMASPHFDFLKACIDKELRKQE